MVSTTLPSLSISPEGNLQRYLHQIRQFPMLEKQEEYMLAKRWREHEDTAAAHKLVTSHLRLVAKIAMRYRSSGLPVSDLISEGNVGLMQAVKRFEPDRGFRLATYAMWWIKASIQEYMLHSWSLVKMGTTAAQKKLFFNLRKIKNKLNAFEDGDLSPEHVEHISTELNVPEKEVVSMNRRLAAQDHSLNAPPKTSGGGEWQDWLEDGTDSQEVIVAEADELQKRRAMLSDAMVALNEREQYIIKMRRLKDDAMTLEELSHKFGISRERVRQIEARAFEKLQKAIQTQLCGATSNY